MDYRLLAYRHVALCTNYVIIMLGNIVISSFLKLYNSMYTQTRGKSTSCIVITGFPLDL